MKWSQQAGKAAVASVLFFSAVPSAWANDVFNVAMAVDTPIMVTSGSNATSAAGLPEVKITKEEAIAIAQKLFPIPDGYKLQNVNLNRNYGNDHTGSWTLTYTKQVEDRYYGNLVIGIHANTGQLLRYSFYENDPDKKPSYPPKVNFLEAKGIAEKWLSEKTTADFKQLQYNEDYEQSMKPPLNGAINYSIRYDRSVNGILFPQDQVQISVNGEGIVTEFYMNWTEGLNFEKPEGAISSEAALKAFQAKADISLRYHIPYSRKGEPQLLTTYRLTPFTLDAKSGEPYNRPGYAAPSNAPKVPITEKPLSDKPAGNLNLSKEQALKIVTDRITLPQGVTLEGASYDEYKDGPIWGKGQSSSWNFNWSNPQTADPYGKGMYSISASVNSMTGEIRSFYSSTPIYPDTKVEEKVTYEQAKQKALDFVKKNLPSYTHQLVMEEMPVDPVWALRANDVPTHSFKFARVIDGVQAINDYVNISIHKTTGDISSYNHNFTPIDFPEKRAEVISLDKAKELLFSLYRVQLVYMQEWLPQQAIPVDLPIEKYNVMVAAGEMFPGSMKSKDAKLVYQLVPTSATIYQTPVLDAVTGQWKNEATGEPFSFEKPKVTDIQGHWAERELQLMLDYQALQVKDGLVNPDMAISKGEMVKMLVIAMNGGDYYDAGYLSSRANTFKDVESSNPYFAYVETAVDRGLVDRRFGSFEPDSKMSREDMADMIVRALGYKSLAENSEIFRNDFKDADQLQSIGNAAIVTGLGIMTLSEGSFNGKEEVTRAQAATAFYRYLEKRQLLQNGGGFYPRG